MRRILFRWRGLTVWSYPAMLYLGLVAGVVAGNLAAHVTGADAFRVFVATLILIPPALAGARMLYVAAHWKHYRDSLGRIWNRQEGGLAMYGGMPIMLLLSVPLVAALGLGFGEFWDAASLTIMTGMVFTKIGCLLNGCCAGRPSQSRVALSLPNSRGAWEKRIPVQCLEAGWAALVLGAAAALLGRLPFDGALFLVVAGLYGAGRLVLESMREREPGAGRIAMGHAVSVVTVISAVAMLVVQWPR
ncbi:MAG TPA: prolipoprotein diacylglyceryl transferase family protein [Terriglobales bacterium]|nr:prolipoprotein diacylglyceryl transferase family protein [Terriglobales bacterium]